MKLRATNLSPRTRARLLALLVVLLWSTSWILIKIGLQEIPPITFAGLRYMLAFLFLSAYGMTRQGYLGELRKLTRHQWLQLIRLAVIFIAFTQGAQFVSLSYLPSATVSLVLNFTSVVVALIGIILLGERPSLVQWAGIGLFVIGVIVYFYPVALANSSPVGLGAAIVCMLGNAFSAILLRLVNRDGHIKPFVVTHISIGAGAAILLTTGIVTQGPGHVSLVSWASLGWLALVNTAIAFHLWNHALRTLSAVEYSVINNTMLIQIAILAWVFLGEALSQQAIVGLVVAALGILLVQLRPTRVREQPQEQPAIHRAEAKPGG